MFETKCYRQNVCRTVRSFHFIGGEVILPMYLLVRSGFLWGTPPALRPHSLAPGVPISPAALGDTWTLSLRPGADAVASGGWTGPASMSGTALDLLGGDVQAGVLLP